MKDAIDLSDQNAAVMRVIERETEAFLKQDFETNPQAAAAVASVSVLNSTAGRAD